jgi:hypothetical protein
MRLPLLGQLLVPVLVSLLVLTTPVGTGQGVHQNELLHPVLAHVHMVNGRIVTDEQLAAARAAAAVESTASQPQAGPALGAGVSADAAGLGIALGPTLPTFSLLAPLQTSQRLLPSQVARPTEFRAPPQDPPPVRFA